MIILLQENTSFLRNKLEVELWKFKIATHLHPASAEAKHRTYQTSQAETKFHTSSQISSRSIADRTRIDEWGTPPMACCSHSLPTSLQQAETCHQESFLLHVRKDLDTATNFPLGQCFENFGRKKIPPQATCIAAQKCMRIWALDIDPWGQLVLTMNEQPSAA